MLGRFSTTNLCWEGIELGEVGKLCTVRKVQKEMGQVWTPNVSQDYHDGCGVGGDDGGGDGGSDGLSLFYLRRFYLPPVLPTTSR